MSYLIAILLMIFSQSGVHANEFKEVLPVQNHSSESILQLTPNEKKWLTKHKTIRIAYDGSLPPYSFVNEQGKIDGIAIEIMAILSERLGINFTIYPDSNWSSLYKAAARRKADMVATMVNRPDRAEWFSFTQPYLTKSLVIVTKQDSAAINNRNDLSDKKVAVVKGYQYGEQITNEFPNVNRVIVKTMLDSLKEVDKGQVDAAILFLGTANYLQAKHQFNNLRIAAFYDRNSANESIAIRKDWPLLVEILQKGLDSLTEDEVQKVFAKWVVGGGIPSTEQAPSPEPVQTQAETPAMKPVSAPVSTPPVVEIEQQPATFSLPKVLTKPTAETLEIGKMLVISLLVLALFLIWLFFIRKQKMLHLKANNEMMNSARNLQSTHNDVMHLTIEPPIDINIEEIKADFRPELEVPEPPAQSSDDCIYYQQDSEGRFSYVSPSVSRILGYSEVDFMANYRSYLTDNPINRQIDDYIDACVQGQPNKPYEIEIYDTEQGVHWLEVTDTPVYDGQGHCTGVEGAMYDVTEQKLADQIAKPETLKIKSPAPQSLLEHLNLAIKTANKNHRSFALIYLEIARLRLLDGSLISLPQNDVLIEASKRLHSTLRDTDIVVQIDAERFALVLPETDASMVTLIIEKIRKILQVPYLVGIQSMVLDANLGSASYPSEYRDPESLFREAQVLFAADVPTSTTTTDDDLKEEESLQLQQDLVAVLDECKISLRATSPHNINALNRHSQFLIHYQSRHDVSDYNIVGFEALIRWQHPQLNQLLPTEFLTLIEDIGLLDVLTYWIIQQVSFQAVAWEKQGIRPKQMIVNLGELSTKQAVEVNKIIAIINEAGANPNWLVLSIAESEIAKNPELVIPIIVQLVAAGIGVAIDNFGSDSSILNLLKSIPAQFIEFDPAFIRTLPNNTEDAEIVTLSIAMLHDLGKTVIAKEVETEQQLEFLKQSGCDVIQGHLLSRPIPAKEAKELMENLPDFAWYLQQ
jgi:PAS domain S-box-containing protein